jgi:serine/threonine-protein kinase
MVQIFMIAGVASTMLATLWLSHVARSSVRRAIVESSRALLVAQMREAQLAEAHNQLDRAIRATVGKQGQHSGKLAGSFRVGNVIGVGAMGEVYDAEHAQDGRAAAVKLLHADTLAREDMVVRFLREAAVCQRFDHANLVAVYEVGRLADRAPFMVMERLHGRSLAVLLRERGRISLHETLELAEAVCSALSHAHDNGVIHRDLKPHNIFAHEAAAPGPAWKILDFGISKLSDSTGTLTRESLVGTPAYMSPEQALGQAVDHRSDLFSLGSVLYRALTGRPAFAGTDTPRVMFDVAYSMPERPSAQCESLPGDVDLVIAIALAKQCEQRFESATALLSALLEAAHSRLPDALRARARTLLAKHPWGSQRSPAA